MQTATLSVKEALFLKAQELSELLAETDELLAYIAAEEDMLNDPEVQALRQRVDETEWAVKELSGQPDVDGSAALTQMYLAKGKWQKHPKVVAYYKAQRRLERLLEQINTVVTYPITGEKEPSGGGGCSSGGCGSK